MQDKNPVLAVAEAAGIHYKAKFGVEKAPQAALAALFDVSPQAVSQWVGDGFLPLDRAIQAEDLFGVPRQTAMDPELVRAVRGE